MIGTTTNLCLDASVGRSQCDLIEVDRVAECAKVLTEVRQIGLELIDG